MEYKTLQLKKKLCGEALRSVDSLRLSLKHVKKKRREENEVKLLFTKGVLLIEGTGQQVPVAKSRGPRRVIKRPLQGYI